MYIHMYMCVYICIYIYTYIYIYKSVDLRIHCVRQIFLLRLSLLRLLDSNFPGSSLWT